MYVVHVWELNVYHKKREKKNNEWGVSENKNEKQHIKLMEMNIIRVSLIATWILSIYSNIQ